MTNDEAITVLELAVDLWHKQAKEHEQPACNCFREEFGQALMTSFGVALYAQLAYPIQKETSPD
jgi:hypothetical protein